MVTVRPIVTRTISHYEILAPIGEGGMGIVYRAVDTRLGRLVALKLLQHERLINTESRTRFIQEARAASALNHPHIITIYDIGQDLGIDFIAMEYVAGQSLAQMIGTSRLAIQDALKYATQIADALAAAHAAGILHRDLKPANIMVTDRASIKVVDFGLAKLTEPADGEGLDERAATATEHGDPGLQTDDGTILGTAGYMSPEQAEGKPADARSDVFAFGAVLYEMITGRRAFAGDTRMSTLAAVLTGAPQPAGDLIPGLSPDLEKLIGRCLRKSPDRRWQSMADLKIALEDLREELSSDRPGESTVTVRSRRRRRASVAGIAVLVLGAVAGATLWLTRRATPSDGPRPFLTRLTSDIGWTDYPAIPLDGKMLAYSSDRSGDGNLDIWVQQVPDGPPVRLTNDAADEVEPSFSADGSRIVYRSSRRGGGVYVGPTLGGEERLLAARAFSPRFSPDGNWIAYGVLEEDGGRIYVAPAAGGPPIRVAAGFYRAQAHIWSPDGRTLLFWGQRDREGPPDKNIDWYTVAVPDGLPVSADARRILVKEGFRAVQGLPFPDAWTSAGNRVLYHGSVGDSSNIWQVALSPQGQTIDGTAKRVTFGTTDEAAASVTSDQRMVFISRTMGADIWTLPIDPNRAKLEGELKRLTQDAADDYDPTLSDDGASLVFRSRRSGRFEVVLKKLGTGAESVLTRMPADHFPALSHDGLRIAYSFPQNGKMPIVVVAANGGTPEQVCVDCGQVEEWSSAADQILYVTTRDPSGVGLLKLGASPDNTWLSHPGYGIYNPRLSSDNRWIAFNGRTDRLAPARVFVARVQGSAVAAEKEWIEISRDGDAPSWSPQANFLYFWSDRDGSPCLWAQRLDPSTKRPVEPPVGIQHFHRRGLSWRNLHLGAPRIAVARDKIVFNLGEHTGNIWMTDISGDRN